MRRQCQHEERHDGCLQPWRRTCMRGFVGDSTMTSAVRPSCTAASTALCSSTDNTRSCGMIQCHDLLTCMHLRHAHVQSARQGIHLISSLPPLEDMQARHVFSAQRHTPDVGHVDIRDLYALVRHHGQQQAAGAAVDVVARHDVLAGLHQAHHRHQRRHATREGKALVCALSGTR